MARNSTPDEVQTANINRSIRTIKAELEYLCDCGTITPVQLSELLQKVPPQTFLHAPISVGALPEAIENASTVQPPSAQMGGLGLNDSSNKRTDSPSHANGAWPNEKHNPPAYTPPAVPPPAWQQPAPLCHAQALYTYASTDEGDLPLQPDDHIAVTEYMNAEWWKGRSTRTGQEGIFPRSYVKVVDEQNAPPKQSQSTNYGNVPLEVSGMGSGDGKVPDKVSQGGKKVGKKLGNAVIFGAGATIGSNLINSIF